MDINRVLKDEAEKISLSEGELKDLRKKADEIVENISRIDKHVKVFIGGSLAKGTIMKKNTQDIDIFAVFKAEEETAKLEEILEKSGFDFKIVHGSRDYFQIRQDNIIFEIIPVLKLTKESTNITDASLSHVNYVKNKISKNKKLAREIILAKAFCYANECYGAESYIKGFSGYCLELLIIYFGGFVKFLKGVQKTRVIDVERYFKNKDEIMRELNESKLLSPVILIDPTYKFRNVAAGLSQETFNSFLQAAKNFLKSPSLKFFEKEGFDEDKFKKKAKKSGAGFIALELRTNKQEGDIAGTKMKKFFEFIARELERKEQKVLGKGFVYNNGQEARGYLIVREKKEVEIQGPPVENKEAIKNFKKVRRKIYKKGKFMWAKEKVSRDDIFLHLKRFEDEMNVWFEVV